MTLTYLRLLPLREELLLPLLVLRLVPSEVTLLSNFFHHLLVYSLQIYLRTCSDDVSGIDSSQWDAIDLERAGNQENTLGQVLKEDDTLAAETASKENKNATGL